MPTTPDEFIAHAKSFKLQNEQEIRTAISRAYYGVFHAANQFHNKLKTPGRLSARAAGAHETLYQRLKNPEVKGELADKSKRIGILAREIKDARVRADYEIDARIEKFEAQAALSDAAQLIALCKT